MDIGTAMGYSDSSSGALYSTDPDYSGSDDAGASLQIEKAVMAYEQGIVGQVIGTTIYGTGPDSKDYLEYVQTAYADQTAANMRTPGSATGGRVDALTYANGGEKMLVINLIKR